MEFMIKFKIEAKDEEDAYRILREYISDRHSQGKQEANVLLDEIIDLSF